jgi:mono/diheme cytochrome c family protein
MSSSDLDKMPAKPVRARRGPSPRTWLVFGFLLLAGGVIAVSVLARERAAAGADASDPQLVALGRDVYARNCASCHGANLEGQPNWRQPLADGSMPAPPHGASGHTWHHNDESLFATTKFGGAATSPVAAPNTMPAFGGTLSDGEIWAALAYIKSTWPPELQERQRQGHGP